jgi:hypothetical protein
VRVATGSAPGRATLSAVTQASRRRSTTAGAVNRPLEKVIVRRVVVGVTAVGLFAIAAGGCGGDDGAGSAERFCGEIAANKDQLTAPVLTSSDDIEPLLDLYRDIGDLAPLSIQQEWTTLVEAYETASTVVIGDPESEQAALAAIYSSEESAAEIDAWLIANCAVDIGPVVTLVPHQP